VTKLDKAVEIIRGMSDVEFLRELSPSSMSLPEILNMSTEELREFIVDEWCPMCFGLKNCDCLLHCSVCWNMEV